MKKHKITAEDLENNPLLESLGFEEGDEIKAPKQGEDFQTFDGEEGGEDTKGGHDPQPTDPVKP